MAVERRRGRRVLAAVGILAAVLLALRFLGPGGSPAERHAGGTPPPPPPAPAPAPAPVPAAEPSLRGRVLDAAGAPVAGATVEALFEIGEGRAPVNASAGPTGADGSFVLRGGPERWEGVLLRAVKGPRSVVADMGEVPGSAASGLALDLRLPATLEVGGIVIAAEDGRPLEGMTAAAAGQEARTDAMGRFRIEGIPAAAPLPDLEVKGAGRRPLRIALEGRSSVDDLLLRAEGE
ncbi:MAG: carboxypeptidase-like regulatory domain-containing protein [Planctomycetes bacterium]|nr:carboxypeptidase-like regulatory domain-containing protein [Planctomycetota bacterium]